MLFFVSMSYVVFRVHELCCFRVHKLCCFCVHELCCFCVHELCLFFLSMSYVAFQPGNNGPGAVRAGAVKGLIKCVGVNYWPVCVPVVVTMGPRQHSGKRDDQVVADPGQNDVVVNSLQ